MCDDEFDSKATAIVAIVSAAVVMCCFFVCAQDSDAYNCSLACQRGHTRMVEVTRTKCVCEVKR